VPERISAHSYGEFPALVAAGAWSLEAAVRATHARCVATKLCKHARGSMLASMAPAEVVEQAVPQTDPPVFVAAYNAPDQIVCAGPEEGLQRLAEVLDRQGFASRLVEAPCPAHTPLMQDIREPMARSLREISFSPPRI